MRSRIIPANEYLRTRWRNGAGWTREIHAQRDGDHGAGNDGGADWNWRLSIAEIERESPFSRFPGIERALVLLRGNGLKLQIDDDQEHLLEPPHGRCRFPGELDVQGFPVDGVVHAFNLMWRRDKVEAELWHRPLVGPMVVFADPGAVWAVYLMAGQARFADASGLQDLDTGDTALLEAGPDRLRHVLDGAGEALLVRLQPRA